MSSSAVTVHPMIVQLYSRPVSSRLSSDPLCLYFRYYVHEGVDGWLTVYTLDNADRRTPQWTLHGHVMHSWHVAFVQINTVSGPFQVPLSLFTFSKIININNINIHDDVAGLRFHSVIARLKRYYVALTTDCSE